MAGVKGRSGGKREGAGRKPPPPVYCEPVVTKDIPEEEPQSIRMLRVIIADVSLDARIRLDAAKALAPYEAVRKGEVGKKEAKQEEAKKAGAGKFSAVPPPLKIVGL